MGIQTGQSNTTVVLENNERVYPCRCGQVHRGDYAAEDYNHHNCLHEATLIGLPAGKNKIQAICPDCGMSWMVAMEKGFLWRSLNEENKNRPSIR